MSERRYTVKTSIGIIYINPTAVDHLYVYTHEHGKDAATAPVVNRVCVYFTLHLNDYGKGFELARNEYGQTHGALYAKRADSVVKDDLSAATRNKILAVVVPAVVDWSRTAEGVRACIEAEVEAAESDIGRANDKVSEAEAKLAEAKVLRAAADRRMAGAVELRSRLDAEGDFAEAFQALREGGMLQSFKDNYLAAAAANGKED